jgi:hypothetical protein
LKLVLKPEWLLLYFHIFTRFTFSKIVIGFHRNATYSFIQFLLFISTYYLLGHSAAGPFGLGSSLGHSSSSDWLGGLVPASHGRLLRLLLLLVASLTAKHVPTASTGTLNERVM